MEKHRRAIPVWRWVLAVALVLAPMTARAQVRDAGAPVAVVGSVVRVTVTGQPAIKGTLLDVGPDVLRLSVDGHPIDIPRASLHTLEVRTGRRGHARMGAAIGGLVGLLALAACDASCRGDAQAGLVLAYPVWGLGIGALIRTDSWTAATPEVRVRPLLSPRSMGVSATIRY